MGFNRGGGFKPRFGNRGPVEMHKAICDNCKKECEVPFKPTNGRPIYCSNCFETQKGGSDSRRFEGRAPAPERSEDRATFDAVCADCGNNCKVPFRPSNDKPVFCKNCFGDKKTVGAKDKFEELNVKLDKILKLLETKEAEKTTKVKEEKPKTTKSKEIKLKEKSPVKEAVIRV